MDEETSFGVKPLISIIVPVYKVERFIRRCIESILAQTYKNLEVICVDDGSPDNSGEILEEYARIDDRIKVIHQLNGGLSVARNTGLSVATGEYIGFVDSDDYISPVMYETMFTALCRTTADIAICQFRSVTESGEIIPRANPPASEVLSANNVYSFFCRERQGLPYFICVWNKLYRKKIYDGLRFTPGITCEDLLIMPYTFERAERIIALDTELYFYTVRADNITNTQDLKKEIDEVNAWLLLCEFLEQRRLQPSKPLQAACMRLCHLYSWIPSKDKEKLETLYMKSTTGLRYEIRQGHLWSKIGCLIFWLTLCSLKSRTLYFLGLFSYHLLLWTKDNAKKRWLKR